MSKRIRLVDNVSNKRFVIETKAGWLNGWDTDTTFSYMYESKSSAKIQAAAYLDNLLEEDVVLYDSKEG